MGLLSTIREDWAAHLATDDAIVAPCEVSARQFFATPGNEIPIYTEKLGTIEEKITNAVKRLGLSIVIVTVVARDAKPASAGQIRFGDIAAVARVFENPKINRSGLGASDCAEAIAWFSRNFRAFEAPLQLQEISLGNDPRAVTYDVIYKIEAGTSLAPFPPNWLLNQDGTPLRNQDGEALLS